MVTVFCHDGDQIQAPSDFLASSAGELWEELHFLGGGTLEMISNFLGRSREATARMLTRLRAYGLVAHHERDGDVIYRALGFENLDLEAVERQRAIWRRQHQIERSNT